MAVLLGNLRATSVDIFVECAARIAAVPRIAAAPHTTALPTRAPTLNPLAPPPLGMAASLASRELPAWTSLQSARHGSPPCLRSLPRLCVRPPQTRSPAPPLPRGWRHRWHRASYQRGHLCRARGTDRRRATNHRRASHHCLAYACAHLKSARPSPTGDGRITGIARATSVDIFAERAARIAAVPQIAAAPVCAPTPNPLGPPQGWSHR